MFCLDAVKEEIQTASLCIIHYIVTMQVASSVQTHPLFTGVQVAISLTGGATWHWQAVFIHWGFLWVFFFVKWPQTVQTMKLVQQDLNLWLWKVSTQTKKAVTRESFKNALRLIPKFQTGFSGMYCSTMLQTGVCVRPLVQKMPDISGVVKIKKGRRKSNANVCLGN